MAYARNHCGFINHGSTASYSEPIEDLIDREVPESTDLHNFSFDGITGATPKDCSEHMDAMRQNFSGLDETGKPIQTYHPAISSFGYEFSM